MKTHVGVSPFLPIGLMIPQRCPFCSFLHPLLGPLFHCSPNPSLPQRHRKQCIVCPATKGNAETSKWPRVPSPYLPPNTPKPWGKLGFSDCQRSLALWHPPVLCSTPPLCFQGGHAGGSPQPLTGLGGESGRATTDQRHRCQSPHARRAGWERLFCSL